MAGNDFYNFNEALDKLRLKEEELKRLVSEGEIRAFREGDTMKLRRQDVEHLKRELMGGEVVELGSDDEIVFEDDSDAGMATEEISDMDTLLDEDVDEIEIEETAPARPRRSAAAPASGGGRPRAAAPAAAEEESESMGFRVAAILTTVVLIMAMPIVLSHSKGVPSDLAKSIAGLFGQEF